MRFQTLKHVSKESVKKHFAGVPYLSSGLGSVPEQHCCSAVSLHREARLKKKHTFSMARHRAGRWKGFEVCCDFPGMIVGDCSLVCFGVDVTKVVSTNFSCHVLLRSQGGPLLMI